MRNHFAHFTEACKTQCSRLPKLLRRFSFFPLRWAFVLLLACASPLNAQSTSDLQTELQQIKQAYAQQIAALESRIAKLEQENRNKNDPSRNDPPQTAPASTLGDTVSVADLEAQAHAAPPAPQRIPAKPLTPRPSFSRSNRTWPTLLAMTKYATRM